MQGVTDVSGKFLHREKSNYEAFIENFKYEIEMVDSVIAVRALVLTCSPCAAFICAKYCESPQLAGLYYQER